MHCTIKRFATLITAALVVAALGSRVAAQNAQDVPYFHYYATLAQQGWEGAIVAHIQTPDWQSSVTMCRDLEQSYLKNRPGYTPGMLSYPAENLLEPPDGAELTACWAGSARQMRSLWSSR